MNLAGQGNINPPHFNWLNWQISSKYIEAQVRMRQMCGSQENLNVDHAMMQTFVNRIGEYGLLYFPPASPDIPQDTVCPWVCSRFILDMAEWHQRDGNPIWIERIHAMALGLAHIAVERYDYAFYPLESSYSAKSNSWVFTNRPGGHHQYYPYTPPDEPAKDQQGIEGSVKFDMGTTVRGLVKAYKLTGDEQLLEISRKIVTWCLLPTMWNDGWQWGLSGQEHGLFEGHFHGNTMPLRGTLDYGVAAGDQKIIGFVREAYEHARMLGLARIGWFPAWTTPERFGRPAWVKTISETCAIADVLTLAVALTDAGVGDYWDDVDHYVRNQLAEQQFIDSDLLASIEAAARTKVPVQKLDTKSKMGLDTQDVRERMIGSFGGAGICYYFDITGGGCCTGNGPVGLFNAWEGIVRYREGQATINLLLNRASPWVDIDSYLPYEGRVRIKNKAATAAAVRIPGWVKIDAVACTIGGVQIQPRRVGRYLMFDRIKLSDVVELRFELPESKTEYLINYETYKISFRGSTVLDVGPRKESDLFYPLYQRQHMNKGPAPMVKRRRFVSSMSQRSEAD
jgi:hypothetical protein